MYCKQYCVCTPPSTALFMDKCKHIKTNPCTYQKCKYSIFIVLWSLKLWPFCNFTKLSEINTKIWKLFIWLTFESTSLFYIKWNSRKKSHRETSCFNTNYDKVWWEVVLKAHKSEFFHVFEWCTDRWRDHTGSQETVVCVCVSVHACVCFFFLSFSPPGGKKYFDSNVLTCPGFSRVSASSFSRGTFVLLSACH